MKASIIITTYRRSDTLLRAINSCLKQTYKDLEIVIVDDNGLNTNYQKETALLLDKLINTDQIKYLPLKENKGSCYARNAGVSASSGEYIFFLDDDDEFLPERVEKQVSMLKENPEYDGQAVSFIKMKNEIEVRASDNTPIIGDFISFLKEGNFYTIMLAIRKKAFEEIGGFKNIPRYQDIYFMYHCLSQNKKIAVSSEQLFIVHEHKGERISTQGIEATKQALKILEEYTIPYKSSISSNDWDAIQVRHLFLLASTLYSSNYSNRLQSISIWFKIYKVSPNTSYLIYIIKSLLPLSIIKKLERLKHS